MSDKNIPAFWTFVTLLVILIEKIVMFYMQTFAPICFSCQPRGACGFENLALVKQKPNWTTSKLVALDKRASTRVCDDENLTSDKF